MITKQQIAERANSLYDVTTTRRRHLHTHPELSFEEKETSAYVAQQLTSLGIEIKTGFAQHGVVGIVRGAHPGRTIGLRADMDALPITEDPSHEVRSVNEGVMHACGHDMHTATLLTVAQILQENKSDIAGTYILIFQPGEETWPGGASIMLKEGALKAFGCEPEIVLGAHVLAEMPVGHIGFRAGAYMASGDEIHLYVKGRGGHGGMPHLLTDNVLIGCETIVALQHLVAREVPATIPMVLSFGKFEAKGATNVIPDTVYMAGTMRTMSEEWRARMKERIRTVAGGIAEAYGAKCEVVVKDGYPSVCNNVELTQRAMELTRELIGSDNVEEMPLRMTAEDFGYYTVAYPAVFYRFGVARPDVTPAGAHTAAFDPDEEALRTSPAVMTWMATQMAKA